MLELWNIFVPVSANSGKRFSTRFHQEWDNKIIAHTGGLTFFPVVNGVYCRNEGGLQREDLIQVQVACEKRIIPTLIKLTKEHYRQQSVMAYRVSDRVIIQ